MLNHVLDFALWSNIAALSGAAAGGAFSPSSLSPNAWYEAGTADMYTDAGTTHVSADGQAVQQWNDKSANARHLSQATSTKRPLYKTGSGKPYALADGVDDAMANASNVSWTDGTGQHWIAISCSFPTNTGLVAMINGTNLVSWVFDNAAVAFMTSWNSTGTGTDETGPAMTGSTPCVLIATVTSTAAEIFLDNVSDGATTLTGSRQTNIAQLFLASNSGVASFANVQIYGLVTGSGTLSSTDRANLQTYMAALHP